MTPTAVLEPVLAPPAAVAEALFEIIDGQRVELPPMSAYAARGSFRIASAITHFVEDKDLGEAVVEALFRAARLPDARRRVVSGSGRASAVSVAGVGAYKREGRRIPNQAPTSAPSRSR